MKLIHSSALVLLTLISSNLYAQRQVLDKVVAIVDEGVVLQSELDERIDEVRANAANGGQPLPPAGELRTQLIESLIVENLQLQLANRMGIRYDDDTINSVMGNIAEQNNMSFDDYVATLEAAGRYVSTREQIRRELMLRDLQRGMVNRRINITDQEIDNFLNSEMGRVSMAPNYVVSQTLIPIDENDPAEIIEAKQQFAELMLEAINNGTPFEQVREVAQRAAATNPPTGFPVSGGELGWRKADGLPTLFMDIVPTMKANEVRGPIRSPNGFHLVKLVEVRGALNSLVKQTHARHILISPNEIRTEEQAKALAQTLRERIEAGEDFAAIARQNSDDSASVVAGGDMGWAHEGGMPAEFAAVNNEMDGDELSEPLKHSHRRQ